MASGTGSTITHLFVYGTLRPGDVRWHMLEPFVVDEGWDDSASGRVYDTGLGYPGALFSEDATVVGRTYALLGASIVRCLEIIDEEEGTVAGDYRRIAITTATGTRAWTYEYGGGTMLSPIDGGDWLRRTR